jgi:HK97 family phage prohead protease
MQSNVTCPWVMKSVGEEGVFRGYASIFNVLDEQGDKVLPGAFKATLRQWQSQAGCPKMLWQHDQREPIGWWKTLKEDQNGLYVEGQLLLKLAKAQEVYEMLKNRMIDGLSIGCRIVEAEQGNSPGERLLKTLDLFEVSLVTFAANTKARITTVKSQDIVPPSEKTLLQSIHKAQQILRFRASSL